MIYLNKLIINNFLQWRLLMENKYHLTREQNIFVAKRNIVDYIWKSANLEGIAVTYPIHK